MKFRMRAILLLGLITTPASVDAQSLPGRTLVWADEFSQGDGTKPDPTKWGYDIGGTGWGNNELQYYTDRTENARIESGHLVIEARAENYGGKIHTSARLLTRTSGRGRMAASRRASRFPRARGSGRRSGC